MSVVNGRVAAGAIAAVLALAASIVKPWEGKRNQPYRDVVGVSTVCYGHTAPDIEERRYSDAECEAFLVRDVSAANIAVRTCIHVTMTTNQEAALTSAVFNLGPRVVCGSTLGKYANAGNWAAACRELTHARNSKGEELGWSYAGGKFFPGLRRRRFAERAICEQATQ